MIYIEDILLKIFEKMEKKVDPWAMPVAFAINFLPDCPDFPEISEKYDRQFLWDLGYKVKNGRTFSTKQAILLLKILKKYKLYVSTLGFEIYSLDLILDNPEYKNQPYESKVTKREVRYLGDGLVAFRFLYNPQLVDEIKKIKSITSKQQDIETRFEFNSEYKIWIVEITNENYQKVMKFIRSFRFGYEEDLEYLFLLCENTKEGQMYINKIDGEDKHEIIIINDKLSSLWLQYHLEMEEVND